MRCREGGVGRGAGEANATSSPRARQADKQEAELREAQDELRQYREKDAAAGKIIELSKRCRALSISHEKERVRADRLQRELEAAGAATRSARAEAAHYPAPDANESMWQGRCRDLEGKFAEAQASCSTLKAENEKFRRVIRAEVGDDAAVERALGGESDRKGRAQQLIVLRERLRRAEKEVATLKAQVVRGGDAKARPAAKTSEAMAELKEALQAAEARATDFKTKCSAAVARKKVLESEHREDKRKLTLVLEKTGNDDKLIEALRREVQKLHGTSLPGGTESHSVLRGLYISLAGKVRAQAEQIAVQGRIIAYLDERVASGPATP